MTDTVAGRAVAMRNFGDLRCRVAVGQRARGDAIVPRRLWGDMQERPIMPGMSGVAECREDAAGQSGSQSNTSPEWSSGMNAAFNAGAACAAMLSGVQPAALWTIRIGRGELNRMTSFMRVPNT